MSCRSTVADAQREVIFALKMPWRVPVIINEHGFVVSADLQFSDRGHTLHVTFTGDFTGQAIWQD